MYHYLTDSGIIYCDFERTSYCPLVIMTNTSTFTCTDQFYNTTKASDVENNIKDVTMNLGLWFTSLYVAATIKRLVNFAKVVG